MSSEYTITGGFKDDDAETYEDPFYCPKVVEVGEDSVLVKRNGPYANQEVWRLPLGDTAKRQMKFKTERWKPKYALVDGTYGKGLDKEPPVIAFTNFSSPWDEMEKLMAIHGDKLSFEAREKGPDVTLNNVEDWAYEPEAGDVVLYEDSEGRIHEFDPEDYRDPEVLTFLYWGERLSQYDIVDIFDSQIDKNVWQTYISEAMREHGIPRRDRFQS